jgi:hypothetical protein
MITDAEYFADLPQFAALNEHLKEVQPIFDDFCTQKGFAYVDRRSLGRFPRMRIKREGTTNIWIELWMEWDKDGHRIEVFKRDLPYSLSAGSDVDVPDGSKDGVRYGIAFRCFSGIPFDKVSAVLRSEMHKALDTLEKFDVQYLKDKGEKTNLGRTAK